MPLDALSQRVIVTLADNLGYLRITPIPMEKLERYKQRQVRRHPAHPMLRTSTYLVAFSVLFLAFWAMSQALLGSIVLSAMVTIIGTVTTIAVLSIAQVGLREKAHWEEYPLIIINPQSMYKPNPVGRGSYSRWNLPGPVLNLVRQIADICPHAKFIYGELRQQSRPLDPYVVVVIGGQRACLAIWDDDHMLLAEQTQRH